MRRNETSHLLKKTAAGAHLVAAQLSLPKLPGHYLRRCRAQRQDAVHRSFLFLLGHELLSGQNLCPVRQVHSLGAAQSSQRPAAYLKTAWFFLPGTHLPQSAHRHHGPPKKHILPLRRPGRALGRPGTGNHPCRSPAGRGGSDAPLLCRAGVRPVLGGGEQAVVLLQPGEPRPLVLPGVDPKSG